MQLNTTSAAVVMACAGFIPWLSQQADKVVNEAPACWARSAQETATMSAAAGSAWNDAIQDGVVTMAEVRAVEAAQLEVDSRRMADARATKANGK